MCGQLPSLLAPTLVLEFPLVHLMAAQSLALEYLMVLKTALSMESKRTSRSASRWSSVGLRFSRLNFLLISSCLDVG